MGLTKAQLEALNLSSFPDNTSQLITPEILRTYNSASIENTVNQDDYTADSASFNSRIDAIVVGTGFVTTSSFNAYTSSNDSKVNSLINATASYANSASVAVVNNAQQAQINSLIAATGSYSTSSVSLASLNAFTASQEAKDLTLASVTASLQSQLTNIGSQSASWDNTSLNAFSASQLTKDATLALYTGSNDTKWSNLAAQSGSWITESETGSFVTSAITASSLVTASISGQTITFTKGDASTFGVVLPSGSVPTDITQLNAFTASQQLINAGYNTFTQSADSRLDSLEAATSSYAISSSVAAVDAAQQQQINALIAVTASFVTSSTDITSLNAFTASAQISLDNLNAFSASQLTKDSTLATYTASVDSSLSNLNSFSASQLTKDATLASYTGSNDTKWATLGAQSGSWIAESETGSFIVNAENNALLDYSTIFTKADGTAINVTNTGANAAALNEFTASADNRLNNLESTSASVNVSVANLNAFSASQLTKDATLATYTASVDASLSNLNGFTASAATQLTNLAASQSIDNTKWNTLGTQSGSWVAESETGSFILNAENNPLIDYTTIFTKADGTTISVTNNGANIDALNAFTASQLDINAGYNTFTSSANTQLTNLAASQSIDNTKWNTLGGQSGSWVTESETGSFARYDVSNPWSADQTFTNISAVSASFQYVQTVFETASVIYSSGSNQFGDASNDVQTLYGSTRIVNELTASGLHYPTADNGAESFIQTDGAGNLSLQYVKTMYQNIRNMETSSIAKGTPLFASGSTGDNVDVYIADAGNPLRMPATLIAGDTSLAAGATGKGIIFGHIQGVDTTGFPAGTAVYVGVGGGWTSTRPTGSSAPVQPLGVVTREGSNGMGIVMTETPNSLPNIQTGYIWVGDGTNQPTAISTGSFVKEDETGSFARLDANQIFTGNNTFTGNTVVSQSAHFGTASFYAPITLANNVTGTGNITLNGNLVANKVSAFDFDSIYLGSQLGGTTANGTFFGYGSTDYTFTLGAYAGGFDNELQTFVDSTGIYLKDFNGGGYNTFLQLLPNTGTNPAPILTRGVEITGSVKLTPASVSTNASYPIPFISASTISKDSIDTLLYNPSQNALFVSASTGNSRIGNSNITISSGSQSGNVGLTSITSVVEAGQYIGFSGNPSKIGAPSLTTSTNPGILALSSSAQPYVAIELQPSASFTDGRVTFPRNVAMLQNLEVTGSLTASLQEGYVWVGNANGKTTTLSTASFVREEETGSFAITGSNSFVGNQYITGGVLISGSLGGTFNYATEIFGTTRVNGTFSTNGLNLSGSATTEAMNSLYQNTLWQHAGNVTFGNQIAGVGSGSLSFVAAGGGNVNISASAVNIDSDLYLDDNGGTTKFLINQNFDAEFIGAKTEWNEAGNTYNHTAAEETVEVVYNGWGSGYDNGYIVNVGSTGTKFQDWNTSYVNQTWLQVPVNNNNNPAPIFTRGLEVTGSTAMKGNLTISGSVTLATSGGDGFAFSGKALYLTNSVQTGITVESPIHFYQVGKGDMYIQNNVAGVGSGSLNITAANNANLNISASSTIVNGKFTNNTPTASSESQINFFNLPAFTGANGVSYAGANFSLQDYASSGLDQNMVIEYYNADYSKYAGLVVGPTSTGNKVQFSINNGVDYNFDEISLNDNGSTTTALIKSDSNILRGATQITGSTDITGSLRATGEFKLTSGGPVGTISASDQPYNLVNPYIHSNSIIILTLKSFSGGGTNPTLYIEGQNEGSASIGFTNDSSAFSFNYMIINPA